MKPLRSAIGRNMRGRIIRYAGLAALAVAVMGSKCTPERDFEPVVTVDVVAPFVAQGEENRYSGETTVLLHQVVDLDQLMDENDITEIRDIRIESVSYRVARPDSGAANRVVSDNVLTVSLDQGPPAELFQVASVAVNAPRFREWTGVELNTAGVALLNAALDDLRAERPVELALVLSGTSSPTDIPTLFVWEARIRFNVIGVHRLKVFEPL